MSMTEADWMAGSDPDRMLDHLLRRETSQARRLLAILGIRTGAVQEGPRAISDRKLRLFAVACCDRVEPLLRDERSRNAVQISAAYADGQADDEELIAAQRAAWVAATASDPSVFAEYVSVAGGSGAGTGKSEYWAARAAAAVASPGIDEVVQSVSYVERAAIQAATEGHSATTWAETIGSSVRAQLLRDMVGNPFRPSPPLPGAVLAWSEGTVRRIAEGIYHDRRLPGGTLDTARLAILADALLDAGCDDEDLIQHCRSAGPHVRGCWAVDLILGMP
jgi:hypothetical protein